MSARDHPNYDLIRAWKDANAVELMQRYGAHSIGIRSSSGPGAGAGEPVLAFYMARRSDEQTDRPAVPAFFEIAQAAGEAEIRVPTEIIYADQAAFEDESPSQ